MATAAREEGIANIRDHCEQHLAQNPGSSYVTWIATLHPENARVSIDPRFLIPENNPWMVVFSEARADLRKEGYNDEGVVVTIPPNATQQDGGDEAGTRRKFGVGFLDFMIGNSLVFMGVAAAFAFELAASCCYLNYWMFTNIVNWCWRQNKALLPLCVPFFLAGKLLQLLDASLLVAGIILVEGISVANYILCTILACSHNQGKAMHQATRKMPHLVRWAFRRHLEGLGGPPRFMFGGQFGQQQRCGPELAETTNT